MDWNQAQSKIRTHVKVGSDVNTPASTYRFVGSVDSIINSERYGYHNERGFTVSIGRSKKVKIPWSMLKECFFQLDSPNGYDGTFFRERFPLQVKNHPCHVHVVGQIFVAAGIAQTDGKRYRMSAV